MTDIYFKYIINNNVICCMDSPYTTSYPFHIQPSSITQLLNSGGSCIFFKKKCIFIRKTKRILACLSRCIQPLGHVKFLGTSKACIFQSLCILLSNSLNVCMSRSPCFLLHCSMASFFWNVPLFWMSENQALFDSRKGYHWRICNLLVGIMWHS